MEPNRWQRVEQLYHAALRVKPEARASFLKDNCHGDEELRSEIESLLSYETSAAEFIESPAVAVVAKLIASDEISQPTADLVANGTVSRRFRILEKLGGGGMGIVYKAEDTKLRRLVALKFLPPELSRDPQALERFQREAYAASGLNHPNICTVYDVDEYRGRPFIAMELLQGQTLEQHIAARPLGTPELLVLAIQISGALEAAHAKGIIHRDIKPSNIFVTAQGQSKILDFGVAKLQGSDFLEQSTSPPGQPNSEHAWNCHLTLTRTGMAVGTAGYMSPEQIRGEALDVRTDLFSFGLVLYEMATGQRAFHGKTVPDLQNAILQHSPSPVRQLNPELPAKLENIVQTATHKDRSSRYQSAVEMRIAFETLKRERERLPLRGWIVTAGVIVFLLAASTSLYLVRSRPSSAPPLPDLKLQQLTVNSFENRVTSGAISTDGKYLAYTDAKGMYVKFLKTGETRALPPPEGFTGKDVQWEIPSAAWLSGNATFLVNAHPEQEPNSWNSDSSSIWLVSILGGPPRKLRSQALAYSTSPDGKVIAFGMNRGRAIWLMGVNGGQERKLYDADVGAAICCANWSPTGQRIMYVRTDQSGVSVVSRDLRGGTVTQIFSPAESGALKDFTWLPDGRLLYSVEEEGSFFGSACNFWTLRLAETGQPLEKPRKLTNWSGFCMGQMSVTADGKHLSFLKWVGHLTSYMGDLAGGGSHFFNLKHFPLSESSDGVVDWSTDSKAVFVVSNRSGNFGIYRQALNEDTADPIITRGYGGDPHVTPDGKWIFYRGDNGQPPATQPAPVMRVPITGGTPQSLFIGRPWAVMSCARFPSNLCAIAEPTKDLKEVIVSSLDVVRGRGPELIRFSMDPVTNDWWFDVSPDGTRIAATASSAGPIHIYSLNGQPTQNVRTRDSNSLLSFAWAADGQSLFLVSGVRGGRTVLHLDLQGNTHLLWENLGGSAETLVKPSPDGRHLALQGWTTNGNIWMTDNF